MGETSSTRVVTGERRFRSHCRHSSACVACIAALIAAVCMVQGAAVTPSMAVKGPHARISCRYTFNCCRPRCQPSGAVLIPDTPSMVAVPKPV